MSAERLYDPRMTFDDFDMSTLESTINTGPVRSDMRISSFPVLHTLPMQDPNLPQPQSLYHEITYVPVWSVPLNLGSHQVSEHPVWASWQDENCFAGQPQSTKAEVIQVRSTRSVWKSTLTVYIVALSASNVDN
jgi:hypothetical protein